MCTLNMERYRQLSSYIRYRPIISNPVVGIYLNKKKTTWNKFQSNKYTKLEPVQLISIKSNID